MFVSGEKEIWKIFYTLECVWVHIKIWLNWKYISVDHKWRSLDLEMILHSDFTFNQCPLSSLTHAKSKELGREIPKVKPVPTCLLSPICLLSLSLWPTKAGLDTACHRSCAFTQEPHPLFHSHSWHSRSRSVSLSLRSLPQAIPLHSGLLSLISLFSLTWTKPPPPYFCFWSLILLLLWWCFGGFCVGDGGFFVGVGGNTVAMAVFSLFLIWILCGWWWVVLVLGGGGWLGLTFSKNRFFYNKLQTQEIIFRHNFHNAVKQ